MKRTLIALLACIGMLQLAGCNTMAGLGEEEDIFSPVPHAMAGMM